MPDESATRASCPDAAAHVTAARIALVAGPAVGLVLLAQQFSVSVEQWCAGVVLAVAGLCAAGFVAGRDSATGDQIRATRAGATAGLLAGFIAALPVMALLLAFALNGQFALNAEEAFRRLEAGGLLRDLLIAGWTSATLARVGVAVQLICYGAGLPVAGLLIGGAAGRAACRIVRQTSDFSETFDL